MSKRVQGERTARRSRFFAKERLHFVLHPLFIAVGAWYALRGELLLFVLSCLVAIQHECAHAFAAARLGYTLKRIVLMPFGAVIDGDLRGLSLKDEISVALWGPLCNLLTAAFFAAVWWFEPTVYAFTDTAYYSSLSIALVNLLPAYPLDGGRVLRCILVRIFLKKQAQWNKAEQKAAIVCRVVSLFFSVGLGAAFGVLAAQGVWNISLALFSVFLLLGAFGNKDKTAAYERMDLSCRDALQKGVVIRRVAVLDTCPIKDAVKYVAKGEYLVLEVFDGDERHLFDLPQNKLSAWFLCAQTPYSTLRELCPKDENGAFLTEKHRKNVQNAQK